MRKSEKTREKILDAALARFRKEGFDGTTMRDVAKDAGVALGAAYYYFPSKDALVMAYYERIQDEHLEKARSAFAEVKSLRAGKANLTDGYAQIKNNEVFLYNVHISPYVYANLAAPDPLRMRKLLLNRQEIRKLIGKVNEQGATLVPLKIYFNERGKAKLALGLARGKKLYDKRATLKQKEADREMQRAMRRNR